MSNTKNIISNRPDPAVLEYIAEGKEIIERVSKNLNAIESGKFNQETLGSLYRDVHTLKGSSQLFGFKFTAQVSHALEACLDPVRKEKMKLTPQVMAACAKNIDLLDQLLSSIESQGKESVDESDVIKLVSLLVETSTSSDKASFEAQNDGPSVEDQQKVEAAISQKSVTETPVPQMRVRDESMTNSESPITLLQTQATNVQATAAVEATIRVHVTLLDRILNLVGELVLVKNQLGQYRHRIEDADFLNTSKSLDVVTSDLQGEIMKTRMQPIETVIGKFQRVVRDIARDMGKKIDLTLEGSETELDKSLLEAIKDPLTHIVSPA